MANGGVTADLLGQEHSRSSGLALEHLLDAAVQIPLTSFHAHDGLADDRESKVTRLDDAGVDGTDGNLVHAGTFHRHERERFDVGLELGHDSVGTEHRVPAARPVAVAHQAVRLRVVAGNDAIQVAYFALKVAGRQRHFGKAGNPGVVPRHPDREIGAQRRGDSDEGIHDAKVVVVLVAGDQGQAAAGVQQCAGVARQLGAVEVAHFDRTSSQVVSHQLIPPRTAVACNSRVPTGSATNATVAVVARAKMIGRRGPWAE